MQFYFVNKPIALIYEKRIVAKSSSKHVKSNRHASRR